MQKINYKNWLLTSYICALLYIGTAYHYLNLQQYNFLLSVITAIILITIVSLIIHLQNKKILLILALVVTLFYILINLFFVFN